MYGTDARKGDARALYMENRQTMWRVVKGGLEFDPCYSGHAAWSVGSRGQWPTLGGNELRGIVTSVVTWRVPFTAAR